MKIRARFIKYGLMRYVGHLDLMRYFQKAIMRAKLPVRYSEGFSPHMLLSFATALGVGITSGGEYMETELTCDMDVADIMERLNAEMAEGIRIVSVHILPDNAKNAMASLSAASYEVADMTDDFGAFTVDELSDILKDFTASGRTIEITKKTKKGEKVMDIAPFIYELKALPFGESSYSKEPFLREEVKGKPVMRMLVSAGSTENIRPEYVIRAIHSFMCVDAELLSSDSLFVHRLDLFENSSDNGLMSMDGVMRNGYFNKSIDIANFS